MSANAKVHAPIWGFDVQGGQLQVGGRPLSQLAQEVGSTPFFAYDRQLLDRRVKEVRATLPDRYDLHYAIKANPMPAVVSHMLQHVDGLDVASAGEMQVAIDAGADPDHISFAGPGKTDEEIFQAVRAGVTLILESLHDARRAAEAGQQQGLVPRVGVRLNPDFELKGSGMRMGGGAKPFGIDREVAGDALREIAAMGLQVDGLHIYAGSQALSVEALDMAQRHTLDMVGELMDGLPGPLRWINTGGGWGIPYFPGENRLDLPRLGDSLEALVIDYNEMLGPCRLITELGRFLVGEAGIYVSRVVDKKVSRGQTFLVTDGGLHHHLAASGNFGQVFRKNYPVVIGNRMVSDGEREVVDIVGCLCTPLDRLGDNVDLPKAEIGDLVVIFQSGAYGRSASPGGFLGHPPAAEVLV